MKVLGLITEYNPFHNGHLYHLEQSKKLSGAEYVLCVMSGNFIQRGEPAIVSKWARTKMALSSGIDLVIELPTVYAMSSAEFFAFGAVKILDSLGIVDYICFGSESGDIGKLDFIAGILNEEPTAYKALLKDYLSRGISYPSARQSALQAYTAGMDQVHGNIDALTGFSNNILGIEYLKALKRVKSTITPLTIQRINNAYRSENLTGSISSATAIRSHLSGKSLSGSAAAAMPASCLDILKEEFDCGRGPLFLSDFTAILLSLIRRMPKKQLVSLPYISEGLENRVKEAAEESGSLDELLDNICTKRYPRTRIQRTLLNLFTGITQSEFETFMEFGGPQYVRILGFNDKGRTLLSLINCKCSLPVIVKTANFKNSCNPLLRRMLEIEAASTDMYVLGYKNPQFKRAGQEFTQNIIRVQ